jgi:uncharacterized protein
MSILRRIKWFRIFLCFGFIFFICYASVGWIASNQLLYPEANKVTDVQLRYLDNPAHYGLVVDERTVLNTPVYVITKGPKQKFEPALTIRERLGSELSKKSHRGTVMMLHGRRACKEFMLPIVARLIELDYRFILLDLPAHGKNASSYAGYGHNESKLATDIFKTLEKELQIPESDPEILMGFSMGGAISLKSASEYPEWDGVISLSTFSDFESVARRQVKGNDWIKNLGILATRHTTYVRAGFSTKDLTPKNWIKNVHVPVMLIHGVEDGLIPLSHSQDLKNGAASKSVDLIKIPKAGHTNALAEGGIDLYEKIARFIFEQKETNIFPPN